MDIGVVLVTYNRIEELKKTVLLYEQQMKSPAYIMIIDNHSTDGTVDFLKKWEREEKNIPHKIVLLPENVGGSGGFYEGMKAALAFEADWIWVADDDAYPEKDALQVMENFAKTHPQIMKNVVALCSKNYGKQGIARGHRCRVKKMGIAGVQIAPIDESEYQKEYFEVDAYSFVGTVIRKSALEKAGLPNRDFFIYADDMEHSMRVGKCGKILCIPQAGVFHNDNNSYSRVASWRDYYATRNILLTYKWHLGSWAYFVRAGCRLLTAFRSRNPEKIRVFVTAMRDAQRGEVGIHLIYRPGWQPEKKYDK